MDHVLEEEKVDQENAVREYAFFFREEDCRAWRLYDA